MSILDSCTVSHSYTVVPSGPGKFILIETYCIGFNANSFKTNCLPSISFIWWIYFQEQKGFFEMKHTWDTNDELVVRYLWAAIFFGFKSPI